MWVMIPEAQTNTLCQKVDWVHYSCNHILTWIKNPHISSIIYMIIYKTTWSLCCIVDTDDISPYPTVVMVTTAHQNPSGIDLKWEAGEPASAKYTVLLNKTTPGRHNKSQRDHYFQWVQTVWDARLDQHNQFPMLDFLNIKAISYRLIENICQNMIENYSLIKSVF